MNYNDYENMLKSIRNKTSFIPETAVVLGSGLGSFADELDIECIIDYKDIDGFPVSTVEGHKGRFVFGYINDIPVAAMQGRVHYYEGYDIVQTTIPIRILKMMGTQNIILTNASGGINKTFDAGDIMLIRDHISVFMPNPLVGENINEFGTRFPDMSNVYNKHLCDIIRSAAAESQIPLKEGVYVQLSGPSYESPAEINMLSILGADAVGMSTVCEAIAANHCGMRVCGISLVTNLASGVSSSPLSHKEVQEAGKKAEPNMKKLLRNCIIAIHRNED